MRNVTGKGIGTWLKTKVWFSINSDTLKKILIAITLLLLLIGAMHADYLALNQ